MATIKKRSSGGKKQSEQEILTMAHGVSDYIAGRKNIFLAVTGIAALAILLIAGFWIKRSLDEQKAGPLFATAYEIYSSSTGPAPDYSVALEKFRGIVKKYPSAASAAMAQYYTGNCLMNLGRNDEALKEYQVFLSRYAKDTFLSGLVYARLGYLYRAMGNQAESVKAFEQSDALIGPGVSTFELAKLYESSGNSVESQKKYKVIAEKLSGTAWAMEAMGKVQKSQASAAPAAPAPKGAK